MDPSRFDSLARALTPGASRRSLLAGLAALAALAGGGAGEDAAGRRRRRCRPACATCRKCVRGRCKPDAAQDGDDCGPGKACQGGACGCAAGFTPCGDRCVDLQTSNDHCGACDTPCTGGICTAGVCVGTGPQGCPAGIEYCANTSTTCPLAAGPSCYCTTDVEGNAACAELFTPNAFCPRVRFGRECVANADCGTGFVCIKAEGCFVCGTEGGTSCNPVCA